MWLGMLLLLARLVAPAMSMPDAAADRLAFQSICHTGTPGQPAEPSRPDHTKCLLCPACHLVAQAALPTPLEPSVPLPPMVAIGASAAVLPATGPPSRMRTAAPPTGPPAPSA